MRGFCNNRVLLLALVAGLFYVGHALHQGSIRPLPSMAGKAVAEERLRGDHYSIQAPAPAFPVCKGFDWEALPSSGDEPRAFRAKVPGGWLIATTLESHGGAGGVSVHTQFVPDVYYWWELR
ncbi:MAG: hypothetical protein K1X74_07200 [Pirellulales bacterium]|nr:hypothetical protein [Pirellulales bacterium]